MTERDFVVAVVKLYTRLPGTPERPRAPDRSLARQWFKQDIPLPEIEAALALAIARRACRAPSAEPLQPIRSLHYFVPVLAEIRSDALDPEYLRHLAGVTDAGRQDTTDTRRRQPP
jgi:hypothetical protein